MKSFKEFIVEMPESGVHAYELDDEEIKLHRGDDWHKNYDQEEPTYFRTKLK